jgi:hypothetical protein
LQLASIYAIFCVPTLPCHDSHFGSAGSNLLEEKT